MSNVTETPVSYAEQAAEMRAQLRAFAQQIPRFVFLSKELRAKLVPTSNVTDEYLLYCAAALDATVKLADGSRTTGPDLRNAIEFDNAFTPLVADLRSYAKALEDTIIVTRSDAGSGGLRTYKVAKTFNGPGAEVLVPHLADMARTVMKRRKKVKPPVDAPPIPAATNSNVTGA